MSGYEQGLGMRGREMHADHTKTILPTTKFGLSLQSGTSPAIENLQHFSPPERRRNLM